MTQYHLSAGWFFSYLTDLTWRWLFWCVRNVYALAHFIEALNRWDDHLHEYLAALELAHQPKPTPEAIKNYRAIWIEGYLEAIANASENQPTTG